MLTCALGWLLVVARLTGVAIAWVVVYYAGMSVYLHLRYGLSFPHMEPLAFPI